MFVYFGVQERLFHYQEQNIEGTRDTCAWLRSQALPTRANEKSKEREEPGRIYHVKNIIDRELNVGERRNSPTLYRVQLR